jgi:hypothetical protein
VLLRKFCNLFQFTIKKYRYIQRRLLQWAPLKCYDAAGIRRGVFLAGPKSEQLLKALYASIKDSSFSLDDIEDCLCDNE